MCESFDLKQMLMGQVISGIEFKYEDMINSCLPPAVGVDPWKMKKREDNQTEPIDL